jgi:hypothetical protein
MDIKELPTGLSENGTDLAPTDDAPAWEEIAAGRFMPRRIRGSCRGRVLG